MATVDNLKAYEALTATHPLPDRQARALMPIVQELQETCLVDGVSTSNVVALRTELKEDIAACQNFCPLFFPGPLRGEGQGEG